MFRLLKIYLILTLNFAAIFALNYDTFILLEFENVSQSKTSDYLRHMLPDIIKDHNLNDNIKIEYAGEIEPYLGIDNQEHKNALIILGQFSVEDFSINVNINVHDISSWEKISKFNDLDEAPKSSDKKKFILFRLPKIHYAAIAALFIVVLYFNLNFIINYFLLNYNDYHYK